MAIACLYPVSGFCFPVIQNVLKQMKLTPHVSKDATCTNFTGTWKGSCSGGDGSHQDATTTITQQGCAFLVADDQLIPLGGFMASSGVSPVDDTHALAGNLSTTAGWNANKSAVQMNYSGSAQFVGQEELVQITGNTLLHIEGSQLLLDGSVAGIQISCAYDKQ